MLKIDLQKLNNKLEKDQIDCTALIKTSSVATQSSNYIIRLKLTAIHECLSLNAAVQYSPVVAIRDVIRFVQGADVRGLQN